MSGVLEPAILARIDGLLLTGEGLLRQRQSYEGNPNYWVQHQLIPQAQAWISSVANLIQLVSPRDSFFLEELKRITTNPDEGRSSLDVGPKNARFAGLG
jgi:hypothetical protein